MKIFLVSIIVLIGFCVSASATFIASDTPNVNTTAPVGDQGWSSMAIYNGGGAVHLGDGWFITARHLGTGGSVNYNSSSYSIDSTSWVNITNSSGSTADIRLFQVSNPDSITGSGSLVNDQALSTGTSLTMIGYGRNVSSVSTNFYSDKGSQTQVKYYEGSTSEMKWGENQISGDQLNYESVGFGYFSDVIETTLSPGVAQGLDKDSGGGVFIEGAVPGEYLLAGIMIGAGRYQDGNGIYALTDTGNPALNSKTYSVNIAAYSDQITQAIPEPSVLMLGSVFAVAGFCIRRVFMI